MTDINRSDIKSQISESYCSKLGYGTAVHGSVLTFHFFIYFSTSIYQSRIIHPYTTFWTSDHQFCIFNRLPSAGRQQYRIVCRRQAIWTLHLPADPVHLHPGTRTHQHASQGPQGTRHSHHQRQ